jgi:hypothetical protein
VAREYWREHLAASGLDAKDAKKLGLKWLSPAAARTTLRLEHPLPHGGIHFPYFSLDGKLDKATCRVRMLADPAAGYMENGFAKYLQPPGTPPRVYLPPYVKWQAVAKDPEVQLMITEGEKKAAAVCKAGIPCVGLGGVWSFQQKDTGVTLLPDLAAFNWVGRKVVIAYDSDWAENKDVRQAAGVLARRLAERGAEVKAALLGGAPGGGKVGVDDLLVARGRKALDAAVEAAFAMTPELEETAAYRSRFVLVRTMSCVYDREEREFYTRKKFEDSFPHDAIQTVSPSGTSRKTTKAKFWWEDPTKQAVRRLVLEPGQPEITVRGDLNRFKGWGLAAKRGPVEPWLELLRIIFQGNKKQIAWFEKWCAYPLKNPGAKLHSAVFVYGGQGVGKTAVGNVLLDIYGKSGRMLQDREVFGDFNGWIGETLFACCDDLAFDERRKSRSTAKMLITAETIEVNEKYIPSYPVDNRCNFYFTANSPGALPLDPTGPNRRFLVVEAPPERPVPKSWYTKTFHNWRAKGGSAYVHDRLQRLRLGDFHPYADAPDSEAKQLVVETGRSGAEAWCAEIRLHTEISIGTVHQFYQLYRTQTGDLRTGIGSFQSSLRAVAASLGQHRIKGERVSLWAIRDPAKWQKASTEKCVAQYNKDRGLL